MMQAEKTKVDVSVVGRLRWHKQTHKHTAQR